MLQDVAAIMRQEVQALIDEGASYVQLDAPSYSNFFDRNRREVLKQSGINLDEALDAAIAADNAMIDGIKRNPDVVIGIHFCRGNKRSAWGAEGSYEPIAEKAFGSLKMDRYLLEFDSRSRRRLRAFALRAQRQDGGAWTGHDERADARVRR